MKKTIQINIAGMVFNIEEDAYEKLNNYLASIKQYFSSYEGSLEIVSDIEARIAEKFWTNQKSDVQPVITTEAVNDLIKSMGSVADFEAIEEEEDLRNSTQTATNSSQSGTHNQTFTENPQAQTGSTQSAQPKRLYRDVKRKALGGVLAGLAHYFNIDVVWVRIIFLFLFMGLPPISEDFGPFSGFVFLGYFICWIVFPPNYNLDEDKKIKKFYRDNDDKVLGGVCSGLGAYFGVDATVIRLLFVLGVFLFGTGFLAYIILWIVAPKAQTLTQKMEMKGEPVTLSNIETNIKESINVDKNAPENSLTKVLLFPFRLVGMVIKGLGEILKHLGPVARVLAGVMLMLFSLVAIVGVVAAVAAFFGVTSGIEGTEFFDNSPFKMFSQDIHPMAGFFAFLAMFTPFLALLLTGLTLLSNRRIGNRNFWISLLGLWLAGLMGTGILATKYALNFKKKGRVEQVKNYPFTLVGKTLVLDANNNQIDDFDEFHVNDDVEVYLEGYDGTDLKLEQRFESSGPTRAEAENNAKNIVYNLSQKDSTLTFDQKIKLAENARFRGQELEMTLYIPFDKPFKITKSFYHSVYRRDWNKHDFDIDGDDVDKYTYVMKRDSGMVCRDCPKLSDEEREALRESNYDDGDSAFDYDVFDQKGQHQKKFADLKGFDKLNVAGAFVVTVRQGSSFEVIADSDDQDVLDDIDFDLRGNTLEIDHKDKFSFGRRNSTIRINITLPTLERLDVSGASTIKVLGFKDKNRDLAIELTGASKAAIDVEARKIEFDASGASKADLRGSAEKINVDVSGACQINATRMEIKQAKVEASGASHVDFGKLEDLDSNTSGASKVSRDN
ncbi:phage shock protein C, PspC [Emticicia oligotrophica DSM 17448]|uniref:Phage shock protein C, PspC n=1 Tax=Emticicia oligotrophica (strain DSM 17448 / CIP 109782 / MTCC 6937 / GPTSA100-15) TaxID=929562 RepID=A0ABN4AEJ2_EMTOG|nr:PspC domain-containing protein [Emticicia oligotrophica]AFK03125.1 phage shock protein C, PspC [Emticicia oligotrophica DSM 17448]